MNLKFTFLLFLMVIFLKIANAQIFPNYKCAQQIKKGTVIFSLMEEDPKWAKWLTKGQNGKYHEDIKYHEEIIKLNDLMAVLAKDYWTFNENTKCMPATEVDKLRKKDRADQYFKVGLNLLVPRVTAGYEKPVLHQTLEMYITGLGVYLPQRGFFTSKEILVYGIMQAQYLLNEAIKNPEIKDKDFRNIIFQNSKELQHKTLYVSDEFLDKDIDAAQFAALYPYPFKIVPYDRVAKAIIDKEDFDFVMIIPFCNEHAVSYDHYFSNSKDGKILGIQSKGFALSSMGKSLSSKSSPNITKVIISEYAKIVAGQ